MTDDTQHAPLVPADVDLRDFAFMPLDVKRLRDSGLTAKASGDEFRAAVLLWCASWHQVPAASLPDDDDELANICGYSRARREWTKVRAGAMRGWQRCSDGRLYHVAVAGKALEAWIEKLASAIGGAAGNAKRWNVEIDTDEMRAQFRQAVAALKRIDPQSRTFRKKVVAVLTMPSRTDSPPESPGDSPPDSPPDRKGQGQGQGHGQGQGQGIGIPVGAADPPPPDPAPRAAVAAPATKGTRLPADWALPKAWGEWALSEFPAWTADKVRSEAAKFADHWHAKTGKDATKADWQATWRNWCRSDIAQRGVQQHRSLAQPVDTVARDAEARRLLGFAPVPPAGPTATTPEAIDG